MLSSAELTVKSSDMQTISSWKEVAPFAGRVVAYKTNSYYLKASKGYVSEDPSIYFGYIREPVIDWEGGERGYWMARLIKPKEVPSNCALMDSKLKSPTSMRLASINEITLIGEAIISDQATFEYMFDKKQVHTILEQNLSKL